MFEFVMAQTGAITFSFFNLFIKQLYISLTHQLKATKYFKYTIISSRKITFELTQGPYIYEGHKNGQKQTKIVSFKNNRIHMHMTNVKTPHLPSFCVGVISVWPNAKHHSMLHISVFFKETKFALLKSICNAKQTNKCKYFFNQD